jgi:rubrerythrin
MSKPVEQIIGEFCDALHSKTLFEPFIASAEAEGYPQIAKMIRAIAASDAARADLVRQHLPNHVQLTNDYFVCPACGLIYEPEATDQCLVDQTPGDRFLVIT